MTLLRSNIMEIGGMQIIGLKLLVTVCCIGSVISHDQSFSKIAIHETVFAVNDAAYVKASPSVLGLKMTVTWTSGYGIEKAKAFVEWGRKGEEKQPSFAATLTIDRNNLCGALAQTVGWRDPSFIHTGFLQGLWPNSVYVTEFHK